MSDAPTTEHKEDKSLSLLASEKFGTDYHGQVEDPENQEAGEEIVEEEAENIDPSQDTESQEESSAEPTDETQEYQEYEISHIAQLLDIDESQLDVNDEGKVILKGKVNGEAIQANVKDLINNYQMYQAADKRLEEAKTRSKTQLQELSEKNEHLQEQFATAGKLIEKAESLLERDSNAIDWQVLREDDPAEYSAKKAEFAERKEEIQKLKQEASREYQDYRQQQQSSMQPSGEVLQEEREKLVEALPEWGDPDKAKEDDEKITKDLLNRGFSIEDIRNVYDHKLVILARDAMLYRQSQSSNDVAKKKVAKVPKVMKPGAPKSHEQANKEKLEKQRKQLKQSGNIDDAFALLKARRD